MGHHQTRKNTTKQGKYLSNKGKYLSNKGKYLSNKEKHHQTRKNLSKQENRLSSKKNTFQNKKNAFQARGRLSSKGYLPLKCRSLQVVGVSGQGKAVVSDGRYGVIGGSILFISMG